MSKTFKFLIILALVLSIFSTVKSYRNGVKIKSFENQSPKPPIESFFKGGENYQRT